MGVCCTGKQFKSEYKNDEVIKTNTMTKGIKNNSFQNAGINYEIQQNILNINLNQLITSINAIMNHSPRLLEDDEYNKFNTTFPINKTNIEYLWNVFIEFKDDFTSCNIINLDFRKNKLENFLIKMKKINYTKQEMINLSADKLENFKRYLKNKIIIVILENEMIEDLSQIIECFFLHQFNISSIKILDTSLNMEIMPMIEKKIINTLDLHNCDDYPFILLSFRYMSHIKLDNYIFYQKVNITQIKNSSHYKFIPEYLSNNKLNKEDPYLLFWNDFNLNFILIISNGVFSEITSDFKRCKTDNEKKAEIITTCCLSFTTLSDRPKALSCVLDKVKQEVTMNHSILVQIDDTFTEETTFEFLLLFFSKVASLPIRLIIEYLSLNLPFIHNVKSMYTQRQKEINEMLNSYGFNK